MNYKLELKQIRNFHAVAFFTNFTLPRASDTTLFLYYLVLCLCKASAGWNTLPIPLVQESGLHVTDLQEWFRRRFQHQALSILRFLKSRITLPTLFSANRLVKFKISDWSKDNTVLEYNYPCKKIQGFSFFPIAKVHELIGIGKCSEMDVILDLWIHAVYNDSSVLGSDSGPIVYYRDNTGNPLTSFNELGERWSLSKASVSRLLKKLEEKRIHYTYLIYRKTRKRNLSQQLPVRDV